MAVKSGRKRTVGASSGSDRGANSIKYLLVTLCVAIFVIGGIILLYIFLPVVADKAKENALIKIPAMATEEQVHDTISKYYGEKYADKVILMSKIRGTDFSKRHGAYLLEVGTPPLKAERKLAVGAQHPLNITINSTRGLDILAEKISKKLDFSPDSLIHYLKSPEALSNYSLAPHEVLALFIDDTYQVYWNSSPKTITEKIGANYNKIWNNERKSKAKKLGLTPAQVIILASIVDEETNKSDEKPMIARLYINRLKKNMKLQADPTVKFALGDFSLRRIRKEHLETDSPYNTYKISGLPPGPIRTVTIKDIDAVLNSPEHEYIYMCAKDDFSGYHNFAKDYATHQANARKYQRALNHRNIK